MRLCAGSSTFCARAWTWADAPAETIGRSGVTCWRRLRDWTEAGVRPRLHEILITELRNAGLLDMEDTTVEDTLSTVLHAA
ncbi:hypothetical protein SUDANB178_06419 [Streptomyces sp. enrichment culture]